MSFLRLFASREQATSYLLIDVGPTSVAGACAVYAPGSTPLLSYGKRVPIETRSDEAPEAAMERALTLICEALGKEGVATLARATGSGRADAVTVAIDAPWQQTIVHMEEKREERPFTFTRRVLTEILERSRSAITEDSDRVVEQHVVGVRLNGYDSPSPLGQVARRATLLILISWIQSSVIATIRTIIREQFHHAHPSFVAGPTLRYQVLLASFPHERDMLILDAASHTGVLSLVRGRTLVAIQEFPGGETEDEWITAVNAALHEIAASYPLPHTVLLVADGADAATHASALESAHMDAWLSKNPPKIIPVSRMPAAQVAVATEATPDIRLALMAQFITLGQRGD